MQITDIRPSRKKGFFVLYADGAFAATVDEETLLHSGIRRGDEISGGQMESLRESAEIKKARQKALRLLAVRDHSKAELARKIAHTATQEAAQQAADRMEQLGLINDDAFARKLARELITVRCYSRQRAYSELLGKGIDRETARQAADSVEADAQEQIRILLGKKYPRGLADERDRRRATALLSRYGYPWEEIRSAIEKIEREEQDAD